MIIGFRSVDCERCDGLERMSGLGCRSLNAHARDWLYFRRSINCEPMREWNPCENVETETITHAATVLHNNHFRAL